LRSASDIPYKVCGM